jgi:hypothetical protein
LKKIPSKPQKVPNSWLLFSGAQIYENALLFSSFKGLVASILSEIKVLGNF